MYILFYTTKPYELEVTYLQKKKKKNHVWVNNYLEMDIRFTVKQVQVQS